MNEALTKYLHLFYGDKAKYSPSEIRRALDSRGVNRHDRADLDNALDAVDRTVLKGGDEIVQQLALPRRGLDVDSIASRPQLLYGGLKDNFVTDGFLALFGHDSRDILEPLTKKISKPAGEIVPPKMDSLIPHKDARFKDELHVVGVQFVGRQPRVWLANTAGDNAIMVDADKYLFLRSHLPNAKIYGTGISTTWLKEDEFGNPVYDAEGHMVWGKLTDNSVLGSDSPLVFVDGDKVSGLLMPVFTNEAPKELGLSADAIHTAGTIKRNKDPFAEQIMRSRAWAKHKGEDSGAIAAVKSLYKEALGDYKSIAEAKKEMAANDYGGK